MKAESDPGQPSKGSEDDGPEKGRGDALRAAVDRTLKATAPAASETRERVSDLLDEVSRAGRDARAELAKRSQEVGERAAEAREELTKTGRDAGVEIVRRGQEASAELARRLEALETRLATLESSLKGEEASPRQQPKPKAEG